MMNLGWPWPILWQGQIWSLRCLIRKKVKLHLAKTVVVYEKKVSLIWTLWMSKVKVIQWPWPKVTRIECPSKISNISETGPIWVRFYIEHLCLTRTEVYVVGPGHMTKMAVMPIYGKNPLKIFFSRTISQMILKPGRKQKGLEPYKSYINDLTGLTMTCFMTRPNLFP